MNRSCKKICGRSKPRENARLGRGRAGERQVGVMLLDEAVNAIAMLSFGGFNLEAQSLAQSAGQEATHGVGLPAGGFHQVVQGSATRPAQQVEDFGRLAAGPRARSGSLARPGALVCAGGRVTRLGGAGLCAGLWLFGRAGWWRGSLLVKMLPGRTDKTLSVTEYWLSR